MRDVRRRVRRLERDVGDGDPDAECTCGLVVLEGTPPTRCAKCGGWLPTIRIIEEVVTDSGEPERQDG